MRRCLFIVLLLAFAAPARAQSPFDFFQDDRSSATRLIESLYNAINRREYARAWSYWGDGALADYEKFVEGYADTERVDVLTGVESSDGAAGSVYYSLPVALAAHDTDGSIQIFAGCYLVRQVNPSIQEPPFRPMHIERGSLRPTDLDFFEAVPAVCDEF